MMTTLIATVLGAFFFGAAGVVGAMLGITFADRLESMPGGPPPVRAPIPLLVAGAALIGAIVTNRQLGSPQIVMLAIVCVALVAIWIVDARRGIVPDVFSVGPLAIILVVALWQHEWNFFVSAAIPFVPFAIAALLSKGRGMGWGDVKLVALGGAVLGAQWAIIAFAVACFAAVVVCYARGKQHGPIAFAPYLTAAIGAAIPMAVLR
ncbi:MAG TPA: A24 family peptidase [Candidatus Baltobacteraceae bacterium]